MLLSTGALAGLAALSTGANLAGNIGTNILNYNIAKQNREFQHDEALLNREWQTNMSNTAYQRSIADMQAAGLNPNIMAGNAAQVGSVSTPQGSTATMTAPQFDNFLNGLTSALNAYSNLKLVNSMIDRNSSQISLNDSIAMLNDSKSYLNDSNIMLNRSKANLNSSQYNVNATQWALNRQLYDLRKRGEAKAVYDKELGSFIRY